MADTADRVVRFLVANACCSECDASYHLEDVHVLNQVHERVWDLAAVCHVCLTLNILRAVVGAPPPDRDRDRAAARRDVALRAARGREHARSSAQDPARQTVHLHEMTAAERSHFRALPPIDADDVLDVAAFLADFDGDFRLLFSSEPGDP